MDGWISEEVGRTGTCYVSVHKQCVGGRRIAARRRISAAARQTGVAMMRVMWTAQVDEARRRSGASGRARLAAEGLSRREAARAAEQAVRVSGLGVAATVR